jgi:uncharacterized membrane protein
MEFVHPEALLIVPLVVMVLRGRLWPRPLLGMLRLGVVVALALVLSQPSWGAVDDGRDVVLVVDVSHSMPVGHLQRAQELAQDIASGLPPGDRIGVVAFGRAAVMLSRPSPALVWPDRIYEVDAEGSSLSDALATAVSMVVPGRNATLLVWSDGEVPEAETAAVARLAARRGIRIDVRPVLRAIGSDVAVHELVVPQEVPIAAPFVVTAVVMATVAGRADWRLLADGEIVRSGSVAIEAGRNTMQLESRLATPGEQVLALEVDLPGDAVPQNNRGMAVVRGVAKARVLCVTPSGREDRLTRSLRAAGIAVVVAGPTAAPLTLGELDGFRAVVLEDVLANELPPGGMRNLAHWVKNLGGGLLMTGGYSSFGVGGYYRSPIESVLPVTMEIREEQRKFGLAMAIALDRSGSMSAGAGLSTKMQLANSGAATAIGLLSPIDSVSVLAVDTLPTVIQELTPVDDLRGLQEVVQSIEPGGGGIYIGEALHACAAQLVGSKQETRHIVIFADASDAENPGDYQRFIPELVASGVTVSVIGLGSKSGSDAPLLLDLASLGQGRCEFVEDATELPRVFAQETIQVARSSLVEEPAAVDVRASLQLLGGMPRTMPAIGGYSVAWPRDLADLDMSAQDELGSPVLAHWQIGLGRSAAFMGEADGALSGDWAEWPGYGDFFATLVRWLAGGDPAGLFVDSYRDGDEVVHELEVDVASAKLLDTARGVGSTPDGATFDLTITPIEPGRVEVRMPLQREGVHRAAVQVGEETVRLPPMSRPYSAEWSLQPDPRNGERVLRGLARRTGGNVAPSVAAISAGPRKARGRLDLSAWLAGLALLLLLVEIAVRRLRLELPRVFGRWAQRWSVRVTTRTQDHGAEAEAEAMPSDTPGAAGPTDQERQGAAAKEPPGPSSEQPPDGLLGALERARKRGQRRI